MSNSKAFIHTILPVGSSDSEHQSTHQVSPTWVVTFVRWSVRDTLRTPSGDANSVRRQLVVENDCVAVSTADSKSTLTPTVSITLVETDVNYSTAVAPGDFIFVNMLNSEKEARHVADAARAGKPINGSHDGFKGIFKVQSVRKSLSVDPGSGIRRVMIKVTGFAFTEFNNTIYFNPYMLDQQAQDNTLLFASYIGRDWTRLVNEKGLTNIQDILRVLIESFIGDGIAPDGQKDKNGIIKSPNVHFSLPKLVGQLMGISGATAAKDLFIYMFGIQQYAAGLGQSLANGMNPKGLSASGRFYTGDQVQGDTTTKPEFWNQVKTWSILNQFTNSPLNELYTAFRIAPNGRVMPTVVFRQTPFTSESYSGGSKVTKFMNLPRWKISPALIFETDIGREEAARVNFVQMFGRTSVTSDGSDISLEIARGNYVYDIGDVQRSGMRPYIVNTNFDEPSNNITDFRSPGWAKILGDAVIGSHLKLNGTIGCAGIVDPIAVGDNLEFDGVVYHIETVSHQCAINPANGDKQFRTTIGLSSGVESSDVKAIRYAEMNHADGYGDRKRDGNNLGIMPGISESQDTVYRPLNLDQPPAQPSGFVQPGVSKVETGE
jgi:hypothetical protein